MKANIYIVVCKWFWCLKNTINWIGNKFYRWMWFEDGRKYSNACLHRPIYILIDKLWSKIFIHIDLLHSICVHIHWINSLCFFIIRIHRKREEKINIKKSLFKEKKFHWWVCRQFQFKHQPINIKTKLTFAPFVR